MLPRGMNVNDGHPPLLADFLSGCGLQIKDNAGWRCL
jgi:hypothetical protein